MANLFAPVVDIVKKQIEVSTSILLTDLISTSDLDGNPISRWRFRDNGFLSYSGYFSINGVKQNAGAWFEVSAAQIGSVRYHAALIPNSETIGVQVYDGGFWSAVDTDAIVTVPFNAYAPVVTGSTGTVLSNEARLISNSTFSISGNGLFSVTDRDGDAPLRFFIVDRATHSTSGYFTLNGVAKQQGQFFLVEASQMGSLRYNSGAFGPQSENIGVMAYDGKYWSTVTDFAINTTANNFAPVITPRNISGNPGGATDALNLFGVADADGNSIKTAWILDTGLNPTSGFFTVNGVQQAAGSFFQVAWRDIGTVKYNFSGQPASEQVRMQIFDGRYVSTIATATATSIARPTVDATTNTVFLDTLESVNFSSLLTKTDAGPDFIRYEVIDLTPSLTSARIVDHNGSRLLGNQVYTYTPAQFSQIQIEGGLADTSRSLDRMMVRAFNGAFWTDWEGYDVHTEPVGPRSLDTNQMINVVDAPFRTITYTFMEGNNVNSSPAPFYFADDEPFAVPLSASQKAMTREVLAMYETFLNVRYVEVAYEFTAAQADFVFLRDAVDGPSNILAFAFFPGGETRGTIRGDVVFDVEDYPDNAPVGLGSGMRATAIHELGHAHGLKHPFDGQPRLPVAIDNDLHTVMSYVRTAGSQSTSEPSSIMLYDIMELQKDYGANTTYRTGDDQYSFDLSNTDLHAFWDAGGTDTINYTNMPFRVSADLRQGQFQSVAVNGADTIHLLIPFGVEIENLRGSANSDSLTGNELRNLIWGNNGDDRLVGNGGNDLLRGGAGSDTYSWRPGDGFDTIDEEGLAGRDLLEIRDINGSLDLLQDDLSFRRIGEDLRIDLSFNRGQSLGSVIIKNQNWGGYRIETLRLLDINGQRVGNDVDLVALMAQATSNPTRFQLTGVQTTFGYIAQPV